MAQNDQPLAQTSLTKLTLGLLGLLLVASAFLFLQKTYGGKDSAVDQGVVALLIVGLCTLIVVEVLPMLQNLKFGKDGVELSFRELGEKVTTTPRPSRPGWPGWKPTSRP